MTRSDFYELVSVVARELQISRELAGELTVFIGDTPEIEDGRVIVRNEAGEEVGRFDETLLP